MEKITLLKDFRELLQLLNSNEVDYLLVGGFAVGLHGYPRATPDIDVWIATDDDNATKVAQTLVEYGFSAGTIDQNRFTLADQIFSIGRKPVCVDIFTSLPGVEYADCKSRAEKRTLDGVEVHVISLEDLKTNKRVSGRNKDLDDLEHLP